MLVFACADCKNIDVSMVFFGVLSSNAVVWRALRSLLGGSVTHSAHIVWLSSYIGLVGCKVQEAWIQESKKNPPFPPLRKKIAKLR